MRPKHAAQHPIYYTQAPVFDWKPRTQASLFDNTTNMDPLIKELFGLTEREFFNMFETPSEP